MVNYKHGISETLIGLMNRFERGEVTKEQYLAVVDALQAVSVDDNQHQFFDAIRALLDKVEKAVAGIDTDN
jgi:hypothetical protein